MDVCAEKNSGSILLPPDVVERFTMGSETGVIVKCGGGAFLLNEDMTPWTGTKPAPGDRVYVEKYSGKQIRGTDGKVYRLMSYNCVGAVYEIPKKEATNVAA
jgi:chaperonin GroES